MITVINVRRLLKSLVVLNLFLLIAASAHAFTPFRDDFNRMATITSGNPLGTGWAVSTTTGAGGNWAIGTGYAGVGYASPNFSSSSEVGAQYVSTADLSTEPAWTTSIDLYRDGSAVAPAPTLGYFSLNANWNGKEIYSNGSSSTGLFFLVSFSTLNMYLVEEKGTTSSTLWSSQGTTQNGMDYFNFGYWHQEWMTFTLFRSGNQVRLTSSGNTRLPADNFDSGWLTTTLANDGFAGVDSFLNVSGFAPPAFDNFVLIPEPSALCLGLVGLGLAIARRATRR